MRLIPRPWQPRSRLGLSAACLSAALVIALVATPGVAALASSPALVIDGSPATLDVPPLVEGGHVLVPMLAVFEQLGARAWFDPASQTAVAQAGATVVRVQVGARTASVNGRSVTMDATPRLVAGRIMVPLQLVARALGVAVDYDAQSNQVFIVSGFHPGSFAAYAGGPVYHPAARSLLSVTDVRPESGQIVGSPYPSIYASFQGGTSAVDPASVTISVDGADVTASATVSSQYVSYTPTSPLTTGVHNVEISGRTEDGTPFSQAWSFQVDAGTAADYGSAAYGGFGASGSLYDWRWFHRFGFFPPGFAVFTPGPLFFVSGGVIEVIFFNRFFPFGNAFFTISGCPGTFALTPWLGNPGFFWGVMQVPFGLRAHHAVITAHFTTPQGRVVAVRSTAPLEIDGTRTTLPPALRYAVLPRLVQHPLTPRDAVVFDHLAGRFDRDTGATAYPPPRINAGTGAGTGVDGNPHVVRPALRPLSPTLREPVFEHPVHPVIAPWGSPSMPIVRQPVIVGPHIQGPSIPIWHAGLPGGMHGVVHLPAPPPRP